MGPESFRDGQRQERKSVEGWEPGLALTLIETRDKILDNRAGRFPIRGFLYP